MEHVSTWQLLVHWSPLAVVTEEGQLSGPTSSSELALQVLHYSLPSGRSTPNLERLRQVRLDVLSGSSDALRIVPQHPDRRVAVGTKQLSHLTSLVTVVRVEKTVRAESRQLTDRTRTVLLRLHLQVIFGCDPVLGFPVIDQHPGKKSTVNLDALTQGTRDAHSSQLVTIASALRIELVEGTIAVTDTTPAFGIGIWMVVWLASGARLLALTIQLCSAPSVLLAKLGLIVKLLVHRAPALGVCVFGIGQLTSSCHTVSVSHWRQNAISSQTRRQLAGVLVDTDRVARNAQWPKSRTPIVRARFLVNTGTHSAPASMSNP